MFPNAVSLFIALFLSTTVVSASRGASAFRGYGDIHKSSEQFRQAHPNVPGAAKADDMYLFFSLHDYDHNGHLDGHELRVAFTEFETKEKGFTTLADVEKLVDAALAKDDHNNDGLINWAEFLQSQREAGNNRGHAIRWSSTSVVKNTSLASKITGLFAASKAMVSLYYNGSKQLFRNSKEASSLIKQKREIETAGGNVQWTRSQYLMVKQTEIDMKKLPPFLILLLLVPESIPFVLVFSPSMIPSTCVSEAQKRKLWEKLKERRELATNGWIQHLSSSSSDSKTPLGWVAQIPLEKFQDPLRGSIVHLATHAPQYFEPRNLSKSVLKDINLSLGLTHRAWFASTLRKALEKHYESVVGDDAYLAGKIQGHSVGLSTLSELQLVEAAEMRGITTTGKSRAEIEEALRMWLAASKNSEGVNVPAGLMFLSTLLRQVK
ncbi:UNVERIFIED_CONTAM: hypothetical protein HDU68_008791 [Siphonaria sp. JEL0065]|nr:hypothetical protein HDU68_008791 [Siphonaria sp. JEL0065]